MNWGTKIVIGMLAFMSFIVALGVLMIRSKTDALIDTNYYERGLNYDQDYQLKEQTINDAASPEIIITNTAIHLHFHSEAKGTLKLIRISDERMDKNLDFQAAEDKRLSLDTKQMASGLWKIIIRWKSSGTEYLYEKELQLP